MCKVSLPTAKTHLIGTHFIGWAEFLAGYCDDKAWLSVGKVKYGILFKLK